MSLQVWLPLNGNLNNQGLSDLTMTNSGATTDSNGKIGSCYYCSSASYLYTNNFYLNTETFSVAYWVKYSTITSWNTYIVSLNNSTSEDYQFMMGSLGSADGSSSSTSLRINAAYSGRISIPKNEWHHCCATWQNNVVTIYVDGEKDSVFSGVTVNSGATHLNINCRSTSTSGAGHGVTGLSSVYVNDIRIYDHCLSAKEVKEISKGLVCHYKLDSNGFGNSNLLSNSHFDSRYTVSDWDTSKNGNLCARGWGGYNGGVDNPSTVYHAHLQEHEGDYVYNYHKTSNEDWLGISQTITGRVEVSKTYTFSCELKRISGKNYADGGLYTKANSSSTSNTFVNFFSFSNFGSVTDNKWHRYSYTFTVDSSVYMTNGAYWYIYGHTGGDGEFLMRRPKLEEGSSATEWIPHSSDSLYNSLGLDSTTELDCSGYGYNGTISGNGNYESGSSRYLSSFTTNGTGRISSSNGFPAGTHPVFTVNFWLKSNEGTFSQWSDVFNIQGNHQIRLEAVYASGSTFEWFNYPLGTSNGFGEFNVSKNVWYMITLVSDGSKFYCYKDASLYDTTIITGAEWITTGATTIGDSSGVYVSISDFRIYSTALSASDIKELYSASASVDKNGNMYAYEFKEV